jgi:RimJ/RimL family protein N-acetyltransferase
MSFYPAPRPVPAELVTPVCIARPLTATDAALDHAAYSASPDTIRIHSGGRWPIADFSVADNREMATQHEQEHRDRRNFTFLLLTRNQAESLGCVYLLPLVPFLQRAQVAAAEVARFSPTTALVTFWLRQDTDGTGFVDEIVPALITWLSTAWRFDDHLFRVNAAETDSIAALERAGLRRWMTVDLPPLPYPYYFYRQPV